MMGALPLKWQTTCSNRLAIMHTVSSRSPRASCKSTAPNAYFYIFLWLFVQFGMGPRSSAVVAGTSAMHRELEEALATLKGTQDALLLPTGAPCSHLADPKRPALQPMQASKYARDCAGFAANMAAVSALAGLGGDRVTILSDELNHASIIDGARLARRSSSAHLAVYRHNDMAHLEQLLQGLPAGGRALVVTDSLFSMVRGWG